MNLLTFPYQNEFFLHICVESMIDWPGWGRVKLIWQTEDWGAGCCCWWGAWAGSPTSPSPWPPRLHSSDTSGRSAGWNTFWICSPSSSKSKHWNRFHFIQRVPCLCQMIYHFHKVVEHHSQSLLWITETFLNKQFLTMGLTAQFAMASQ